MRYLAFLTFSFCLFFVENISAQDYNSMPSAIQQKMDENKINGINVYSQIETHFEVEVGHLLNEDISSLKEGFENDTRVKSVSLTNNNGVNLIVIAEGNYTIKDVKAHVVNTTGSIENYTVNYEISQ